MINEPMLYFYAGAGALILWGKMGKRGREVYCLSDILKRCTKDSVRMVIEPLVFVVFGAVVAVGIVQPSTAARAVAAGLGWTGLASKG
jgi:hypothetical protein